jgi:hypothetical protein
VSSVRQGGSNLSITNEIYPMTDFKTETRKRCRNPKCRSKLPAPVSNEREAFCTAGCYRAFYRHRCVICEEEFERKNEAQKVCRKRKCRNALDQLRKADFALGRYFPRSSGEAPQKTPDFIESKLPIKPDRASVSRFGSQGSDVLAGTGCANSSQSSTRYSPLGPSMRCQL